MEIVEGQWPPNFDQIEAKFKTRDRTNVLYAFDGKIYNPSKAVIPEHLLVHEGVHLVRQTMNNLTPLKWWELYIKDSTFRLSEECAAHRAEWNTFVKNFADRNTRARHLHFMCQRLSGSLYDNMCTMTEARRYITGTG